MHKYKKIFLRIKNGKPVKISYRKDSDTLYTIELSFETGVFKMHAYYFDGNDVTKEENYKDEFFAETSSFDQLIELVSIKFPGIEITAATTSIS